jgi:hypothetical protein
MKQPTIIAGGLLVALSLAAAAPARVAAQSLMVGADGAIHLDELQEARPGAPIIIQQPPALIGPSMVAPGPPGYNQLPAPLGAGYQPYGDCNVPFAPFGPVTVAAAEQPLPIKFGVFGEFLYLHPTGADIAHAQQVRGPGNAATSPFGQVGVTDLQYEPGVRVGGDMAVSPTTSVAASYTYFESDSVSQVTAPPAAGGFAGVESLVHHPDFSAAIADGPVDAHSGLDFQLADAEYRVRLRQGERHWINGGVGLRYGHLEQEFAQSGSFLFGSVDTHAEVDFDGGGAKLSLDGGRTIGRWGFSFYGRAGLSPLAGQYRSNYAINRDALNETVIQVAWKDDRITTLLDYEAGLAWTGPRRRWRFSAGYMQSLWFNAVTTAEFIDAVQASDYADVSDTIMFDGLTARVEHLW